MVTLGTCLTMYAKKFKSPINQQTLGPTAKLAVSDAVSDAASGPAL